MSRVRKVDIHKMLLDIKLNNYKYQRSGQIGQKPDSFSSECSKGRLKGFDQRLKDSRTAITAGSFIDSAKISSKVIQGGIDVAVPMSSWDPPQLSLKIKIYI